MNKSGISTYCPHCDEPFTMYPFGQEVIDSAELAALRQRVEELERALMPFADAAEGFTDEAGEDDLYYIDCGMIYDNIVLSDDSTLKVKHLKRAHELLD